MAAFRRNLVAHTIRALLVSAAFLLAVSITAPWASAQQVVVRGELRGGAGEPVVAAEIIVAAGSDTVRTQSDAQGLFRVAVSSALPVVVRVEHVGYHPASRLVRGDERQRTLTIQLEPRAVSLDAIEVAAGSERERLRERPLAAAAVNARDATLQTAGTAEAIDREAGVRIRQSGGLGSPSTISIHGLAGRQVRSFVDGLPQEFLGPAASVAALSLGSLDRVEIYKGVVPVELGGDALGGALNFVTASEPGQARLTLGAGSFGTRRADLAARTRDARWQAAIGITHAASRNDYVIDATIPDEHNQPQPIRARRFHDAYRVTRITTELKWQPAPSVGAFRLRFVGGAEDDEVQHAAVMAQPYGAAVASERMLGAVLGWERTSDRWSFSADAGHSRVRGEFVDTTLNVYAWDGSIIRRRDYGGEISSSRNQLRLDTHNRLGRGQLAFRLGTGSLRVHALHLGFDRSGRDTVAAAYYGTDPFRHPSSLKRTVIGAGWEGAWSAVRLRTELGLKHYRYTADGFTLQNQQFVPTPRQSDSRSGMLAGAAWRPVEAISVRASWELATRMPDVREVMGDFALVRPNPLLRPERSSNFNVGIQLNHERVFAELAGFFRGTDDIVFLRTSQFFSIHENLLKSRTLGLEAAVEARVSEAFSARASATWQDIRNRSPQGQSTTVADRYFNARLPNTPFLFGSAQATLRLPTRRWSGDTRLWWSTNFVDEFFLHWEVDGHRDSKAVVPRQIVHNVGFTRELMDGRVRLNAELQNAFDARAYDVFSVPRPGRAVQVSARTILWQNPRSGALPDAASNR